VISLRVPATDVELVRVGATRVPTSYYKGVRDMDQHDYGYISPTRNLSDVYCAPTAAASCVRYWAENGFPNLVTGTDTLTNYTGLVEGLAGDMGTGEYGTLPGRFEDGLRRWIRRRGYTGTLRVRHHHSPDQSGADGPTVEDYVRELHTNQEDVLVWLGWYDADGNRYGGHAVTANSFHIRRAPTVTYQVDMMDPWLGQVVTLTWEIVSPPRVLTETARWIEATPGGPVTRTLTFTRVLHGRVTGFPGDPALVGWVENLFTVSTTDTHAAPGAVVAKPASLAPSAGWAPIGQDADGSDGWSVTWNPQGWQPGLYMVAMTALDSTGREGTTMRMVWVDQPRRIFLPLVLKSG
jgi:hypothetical protein